MKKALFSLILISLTVISCDKENIDQTATPYISFNIDGVQKTFKANAISAKVSLDDRDSIALSAYQDNTSEESFNIRIVCRSKKISTATYVDPGPDSVDIVLLAAYRPTSDEPAKGCSAGLQKVDNGNPRLTLTFTSLSEKNVTGIFSGTFYNNDGVGPGKSAISGKFDLPVYQIQE